MLNCQPANEYGCDQDLAYRVLSCFLSLGLAYKPPLRRIQVQSLSSAAMSKHGNKCGEIPTSAPRIQAQTRTHHPRSGHFRPSLRPLPTCSRSGGSILPCRTRPPVSASQQTL